MKSVVKFSLLSAAIVAAVFSAAAHAAPGASDSPTLQRWQAGRPVANIAG